jgi:hypothetical protein
MFCTGGIRCEKATAFMRARGFENVYHLKGGILKYLEEVDERDSLWEGSCFVFDERVSVTHGLREGDEILCRACRNPVTPRRTASPLFEEGASCPHCYHSAATKTANVSARVTVRCSPQGRRTPKTEKHERPPRTTLTIVGAGIVGIATAALLSEAGHTVTVIDRTGIAEETSKGNAAALAFSDIMPLASPKIMLKAPKWLLDPLGPLSIRPSYLPQLAPGCGNSGRQACHPGSMPRSRPRAI